MILLHESSVVHESEYKKMEHVDIENPTKKFQKHLNLPNNSRIIFSSAFGTGKTYFLNNFFKDHENYLTVRIAPTNYSITTNDDIFKLIKFDIITELILNNEIQFSSNEVLFADKIFLLLHKVDEFFSDLLSGIPELNKPASLLESVYSKIGEYQKSLKQLEENNELKGINDFMSDTANLPQIKFDFTSSIISDLLERLSVEKESVLIIDDLDRVDPAHIFRILNVFSAHLDFRNGDENKFGFDKIVIACDIDNIRNIYHNRYGQPTDFSGYIDKFFTHDVFKFDNSEALKERIQDWLISFTTNKHIKLVEGLLNNNSALQTIIKLLIDANALSIRMIEYKFRKEYDYDIADIPIKGVPINVKNYQINAIFYLEFLQWIYGDLQYLNNSLIKTREFINRNPIYTSQNDYELSGIYAEQILLIDYNKHGFKRQKEDDSHTFQFGDVNLEYGISVSIKGGQIFRYNCNIHESDNFELNLRRLNYFDLIHKSFQTYFKYDLNN